MNKLMTAEQAIRRVKDHDVLLVGGFLAGGSPERLLQALLENSGASGLTIVNNDTGWQYQNTYKLMEQGRVAKVYSTWIGGNPLTGRMLMDNPGSVVLTPQGTLAEQIRAAGCGIPAFLTPTGVGTVVAKGKETVEMDGRKYLMEKALHGDVALIHATKADAFGNCYMRGSTKNFNAIMPMAAKYTIVEAKEVVPVGAIDPDLITVSGIFVHAIVQL